MTSLALLFQGHAPLLQVDPDSATQLLTLSSVAYLSLTSHYGCKPLRITSRGDAGNIQSDASNSSI